MARASRPFLILSAVASLLGACGAPGGSSGREASVRAASGPVHFIQTGRPNPVQLTGARPGRLTLDSRGCLRVDGRTAVWPLEAALDLSRAGVVRIYDRRDGAAVQVGQPIAYAAAEGRSSSLSRPLAPCDGPPLHINFFRADGAGA